MQHEAAAAGDDGDRVPGLSAEDLSCRKAG